MSRGHGAIPATTPVATALYVVTGLIVLAYTIGIAVVGPSMYADRTPPARAACSLKM